MMTPTSASTPEAKGRVELDLFPAPGPSSPIRPLAWIVGLRDELWELYRYRGVLQDMVVQELRVRYQRSMLGFVWTLVNPILMMTTLTLVFSQLFQVTAKSYAVYLFSGMVPWALLSGILNESAVCFINNEGLIRRIYLPKLIFPLARVLINLVTFTLSMSALFLLMQLLGVTFGWSVLLLPIPVLLFTVFALGLALALSIANTFFRDVGHLVSVFLQAWYFFTPIIYEVRLIPAEHRWRFWLNPAYPFIQMFQDVIHKGQVPPPAVILAGSGLALVSLGIGYGVFKWCEDRLVFRL